MSFVFKWFLPKWLNRYLKEIDEEREAREIYYGKEKHEVDYKSVMTELLKVKQNYRKKLDFEADSCAVNVRLKLMILNKRYNLRSMKQKKQQVEYARLSNWLTKIDKIKEQKEKPKYPSFY